MHVKFHYNLYHKYAAPTPTLASEEANTLRSIRYLKPQSLLSPSIHKQEVPKIVEDQPPAGFVKSILPCTPLAIVKCLEHIGVYNKILPYGDKAYGKTVTVINRFVAVCLSIRGCIETQVSCIRSEVVGRPLAALLANDGARVFSVDIDSIQVCRVLLSHASWMR